MFRFLPRTVIIKLVSGRGLVGPVWQWLGMSSAFMMAAMLTTIAAIALQVPAGGYSGRKG